MTPLEHTTQRLIDAGTNTLEAPAIARQFHDNRDTATHEQLDKIRTLRLYAQQNTQVLESTHHAK